MAEILDRKYHSITFETADGSKKYNTFINLFLIPDGRPHVEVPEVKTNFIDIPGANGSLDYSEALGGIRYKDRTGSWDFFVYSDWGTDSQGAWAGRLSTILSSIHGKYFEKITLLDEPEYYYSGRVWVEKFNPQSDYSKVTIKYQLDPYKTPVQTEHTADWLWDELFDNIIRYGKFNVSKTKDRTIFTGDDGKVYFLSDNPISVLIHGGSGVPIQIPANEPTEVVMDSGSRITITGTANVEITTEAPKIL
jgi:hypothetical protein